MPRTSTVSSIPTHKGPTTRVATRCPHMQPNPNSIHNPIAMDSPTSQPKPYRPINELRLPTPTLAQEMGIVGKGQRSHWAWDIYTESDYLNTASTMDSRYMIRGFNTAVHSHTHTEATDDVRMSYLPPLIPPFLRASGHRYMSWSGFDVGNSWSFLEGSYHSLLSLT